MPETARPWPCYPTAHLGDKELSRCSLAAEGLLWRMCSMSSTGEPFGYLTDSDGAPYTVDDLIESKSAAILRGKETEETIKEALSALLAEGRIGLDGGRYYVPKMVRIGEARAKASDDGRLGGNPALRGPRHAPRKPVDGPRTDLTDVPPTPLPPTTDADNTLRYTLADCQRAADGVGLTPKQIEGFFLHYAGVDFVDGAGRQIVSLKHSLAKWKARDQQAAPLPDKESDPGILDYAKQFVALRDYKQGEGTGDIFRKARDNYGPAGVVRIKAAVAEMDRQAKKGAEV